MKKKKILSVALLLGLSAILLVTTPMTRVSADNRTDLQEAEKEKESLEKDLKEAQDLIDSLKDSKSDVKQDVDKLNEKLNEISDKIDDLETQLKEKQQEIEDMEAALANAKDQEAVQYENMKKRIKFLYENNQNSNLEMLLSSESFTDFLNTAEYITQISQYDRKMLKAYQSTQETIAQTQKDLEQEYTNLASLEEKVKAEKQAVAALQAAKKGELAEVTEDLTDAEALAKSYEDEIKAQNEVIAQIQAAQKKAEQSGGNTNSSSSSSTSSGNQTQGTGTMMWPCPSSHRITSDYGPRTSPTAGASTNHKGIDIGAAYGADIVAADSGVVLISTYSQSAGNYIVIDHGDGICTVYMHASSRLVSVGNTVTRGQVIAKVGSTGYSTGNHLHFGVTVNGSYVSPWGYVK